MSPLPWGIIVPVFFGGAILIVVLYVEYRRRKKKRAMERCASLPLVTVPPTPFPFCLLLEKNHVQRNHDSLCCIYSPFLSSLLRYRGGDSRGVRAGSRRRDRKTREKSLL